MNNKVPFLDLVGIHVELEEELAEVFKSALKTAGFIGGPMVEGFERDFATFCGVEHCVGVNSGTDALRFALMAAGVKPGETVVTVPNSFIATTEAISQAGGRPEFVDIDERTYNMDPALLEKRLKNGRRVAAIVPVHLYGQTADMDPILELAERYGATVLEDACQAHGAEYFSRREQQWRKAGSMGRAAAFSFYPGKNLGACGEGGAVTTNDAALAQHIRMLRDHGQAKKYYHDMEGYNGRLDAIQAGILRVKLRELPSWNEKRREAAARYLELFEAAGLGHLAPYREKWVQPDENGDSQPFRRQREMEAVPHFRARNGGSPPFFRAVYHLYVIRVQDRDGLIKHLAEAGIGAGIHYPIPLHLQNAYRAMGHRAGDFPVCEGAAEEIVSLPMFPGLSAEQQERVVAAVAEFVQGKKVRVTVAG